MTKFNSSRWPLDTADVAVENFGVLFGDWDDVLGLGERQLDLLLWGEVGQHVETFRSHLGLSVED